MSSENKNNYYEHLHQKRKESYKRIQDAHSKYIDSNTGLFDFRFMNNRVCPVCDSDKYFSVFRKSGGIYVKCVECGMIYTNPCFSEEDLIDYYKNLDVGHSDNLQNETDFFRNIYTSGLKLFSQYATEKRILDIGCSSGFFLDIARENGYKTSGVELNRLDVEIASSKGHLIYNKNIFDIVFPEKFDVVTMWDVFEHIVNPKEYLKKVFDMIETNGVLFLQVPNSNSIAAKVLQQKCNMYDGL